MNTSACTKVRHPHHPKALGQKPTSSIKMIAFHEVAISKVRSKA